MPTERLHLAIMTDARGLIQKVLEGELRQAEIAAKRGDTETAASEVERAMLKLKRVANMLGGWSGN